MPPRGRDWAPITWSTLLAPYSAGGALAGGFHLADIRRGGENDVMLSVTAPDGHRAAEIHIVPRGCWAGVVETRSFGVAYETASSPAPERVAITEGIAATIGDRDSGLPPPDAIPLRSGFDAVALRATLGGWSGLVLLLSAALLVSVPFARAAPVVLIAIALGIIGLIARASGALVGGQGVCPASATPGIDLSIRAIQVLWVVLIATAPVLCWRAGTTSGIGGRRLLLAVSAATLLAFGAVLGRGDEPLHANGHAWLEARQVLMPWGGRNAGTETYLHGKAAPALEWLLASAEHVATGRANPFDISRIAGAAAAGACALLVAILLGSAGAGFAAGAALALMPLAQTYNVSGSALAVSAWMLPWSLGLLIAAGASGDRVLLAGAALAGVLGSLSHTAMLALFPAMAAGWLVIAAAPLRRDRFAIAAGACVAAAWLSELLNGAGMLATRNASNPVGLLGAAALGLWDRNLFLDPQWTSPLLVLLAVLGVVIGATRRGIRRLAVPVIALVLAAAPFFAVTQCSSDAVRYQGTLLGLVTSLAIVGIWEATSVAGLGTTARAGLRLALWAGLILLPPAAWRAPTDPAVVEHRLVADAVAQMQPGTLVVLPRAPSPRMVFDFPDFLLPPDSTVVSAGDPAIQTHRGPLLFYLGLACVSLDEVAAPSAGMRPECLALRAHAEPWLVRSLRNAELPHQRNGPVWTFHRLATDVPFGFFRPAAEGGA